jgi:hypothetical protein
VSTRTEIQPIILVEFWKSEKLVEVLTLVLGESKVLGMRTFKVTDYRDWEEEGEVPYSEGFFLADNVRSTKFTDADTAQAMRLNPAAYLGTETYHVFDSYLGVVLVPDYQLEVVND